MENGWREWMVTVDPHGGRLGLVVGAAGCAGWRPPVGAAWAALAPSRRKEILSYMNSLKTAASLEHNVRKVVARLRPVTRTWPRGTRDG